MSNTPPTARSFRVVPRLATLLVLIAFAGCDCNGSEGPDGGPVEQVVMLDEGGGSTNDELLWRLQPGTRIGDAVILPPEDFRGVTAMPWALSYRGPAMTDAAPFEPSPWLYLSQDDEGNIWFHGQPREGRLDTPALLVPAQVRVGMKWHTSTAGRYTENFYGTVDVDYERCVNIGRSVYPGHNCKENNPRFTVEVTGRRLEDTIYGVRTVWYFVVTDWRAIGFDGRKAWPDDKITDGVSFEIRFAEGRGPLRTRFSIKGQANTAGVMPLDEAPAPTALPQIQLEPLNGGEPVTDNYLAHSASGFHVPGRFGTDPILVSSGATMAYGQAAVEDTGFRQGLWTAVGEDHCLVPDGASDEDCIPGTFVTVSSEGDSRHTFDELLGVYEDAGGNFQGLKRGFIEGVDGMARGWVTSGDEWATPEENDFIPHLGGPVILGDPSGDMFRMLHLSTGTGEGEPALGFGAWDEANRRLTSSQAVYPQHMDVNVFSGPTGKEVLLTTFGGRIDRVHLTDTGVELEPIGDVVLPDKQFMTGAMLVGDELVVYTQRGFKGGDTWYDRGFFNCDTCEGVEWNSFPELGETMIWRADLPAAQPAERPSPIWGVTSRPHGRDMKVCWPPGHDSPSLDGWTLGGHEPRQVKVVGGEDRCVLLSRDLAVGDNLHAASAWTVEGPLPGAGRVAIGTNHQFAEATATVAANTPVTANGFLVSPGLVSSDGNTASRADMRFYQALADIRTNGSLFSLQLLDWMLVYPDRAGGGLWFFDKGFKTLSRWDGDVLHDYPDITLSETDFHDLPSSPGVVTFRGMSEAGGMLFESFHIGLDGTRTPLPAEAAEFTDWIQLVDGTICGNRRVQPPSSARVFACLNDDGSYRDGAAPLNTAEYVTGGDGTLYLLHDPERSSQRGLWAYDTTTMTQRQVDLDALGVDSNPDDTFAMTTARSADGVTYGVLSVNRVAYSDHHLLRFGDPLTRIERPELQYLAREDSVQLAVDPDYFLLGSLRIPRENDAPRAQSDFPTGEADCVPLVANEQGTLTSVMYTKMVSPFCPDFASECTNDTETVSYGPVGTGWGPAMCSKAEFWLNTNNGVADVIEVTDSKGLPVPHEIRDLSERGQLIRVPDLPLFEKLTVRVQQGDSPATTIDFKTANSGEQFDLGRIFVGEGAPGTFLGIVTGLGCGIASPNVESGCDFSGALHPDTGRFLVSFGGDAKLIEADADNGVGITPLPTAGLFSPDGSVIVGPGGVVHAETRQSVTTPASIDFDVPPVFALPEHPRMLLARADGTGVVVDWNAATGELTEGIATQGAEFASFSGDGQSVVVLEPYQTTTDFEYARYDLTTGARTVLWLGRRLEAVATNGAGDAVYGYDAATRLVLVAQEGEMERWSSQPLGQLNADLELAFAVNRRGKGAIWMREESVSEATLVRFDEDAVPAMMGEPPNDILPLATSMRFRPRASGDDALVFFDGTDTIVADAGDGATLHTFPGDWNVQHRLDGRLLLNANDCGADPTNCRRIVALTTDASGIHEEVTDPDHHQEVWPYGAERERHDAFGQTSTNNSQLYWRHFDPTGLDMPCLVFEGYQYDYRAAFNGEDITLVEGIYCY